MTIIVGMERCIKKCKIFSAAANSKKVIFVLKIWNWVVGWMDVKTIIEIAYTNEQSTNRN